MRQAVTGTSWPMRWTRSIAWVCSADVQLSSANTTFEATWRFTPTPAAVNEHTITFTSGFVVNWSIASWRTEAVWSPRI